MENETHLLTEKAAPAPVFAPPEGLALAVGRAVMDGLRDKLGSEEAATEYASVITSATAPGTPERRRQDRTWAVFYQRITALPPLGAE